MMLNSFLKWIRLLSLSTLFINDLHTYMNCLKSLGLSDHVDWKMNTTEKPRIQKTALKLVQKILFLIYCLSLYFFWRFDETFDMVLPEGTELSKTYLLFSVKDQSPVLGEGLLLGEALLPLADIVKEDGDVSLKVSVFIF